MSAVSPDLLTEEEVAAQTGLSVSWLKSCRQYGGGPPFVRVKRAPLYPVGTLRVWIAKSIRMANAPRLMYRQWLRDHDLTEAPRVQG
jgi:hypothetical protein